METLIDHYDFYGLRGGRGDFYDLRGGRGDFYDLRGGGDGLDDAYDGVRGSFPGHGQE